MGNCFGGPKMAVIGSLKQHKQIVIYRFCLQVGKDAICLWQGSRNSEI